MLWSSYPWRMSKVGTILSNLLQLTALQSGDKLDDFQRSLSTSSVLRLYTNPKLCEHTSLVYQALINGTYANNCSKY